MKQIECFDICIIGSGPASAFFAKEISEKVESIAIVESGNSSIDMDLANTVDIKNSNISGNINFGLSNQVGGSSNLWGGGLIKLNEIDLVKRPLFNLEGWPIKFNELKTYYKRVDKYLDLNGTSDSKFRSSKLELRECEEMYYPFKTQNIIDNNIKLFKDLEAQKFNCDDITSKVLSLTCYDKKLNSIRYIKAKKFILAAGGINNIRIMLHSFNDIKESLSFDYSNIGKGISTHPKSEIGEISLYPNENKSHNFYNIEKKESSFFHYQVGLVEKTLLENKLLNHCLRIRTPGKSILVKIIEKISSLVLNIKPGILSNTFLSKPIVRFGHILYKTSENLDFSTKNNKLLKVRCFFDQERRNSNEILLSSNLSQSGLPLAKINWQFNRRDWDNVELFLSLVKEEFEELKIGKFKYSVPTNYTGIHSHFMGGTIMGIGGSGDGSVVDNNLKVHGIENLYISGPSVWPSFGYSNPFYTIAALSIRLSDHIKGNLK
jgi:choline dehydrogenase-like flavoprotein